MPYIYVCVGLSWLCLKNVSHHTPFCSNAINAHNQQQNLEYILHTYAVTRKRHAAVAILLSSSESIISSILTEDCHHCMAMLYMGNADQATK